jgi:hypothetical protein
MIIGHTYWIARWLISSCREAKQTASRAWYHALTLTYKKTYDVESNSVFNQQNLDAHNAKQIFTYMIYTQEFIVKNWTVKRSLNTCYASFLPELSEYQDNDDALHLDVNGLYSFPLIPLALNASWTSDTFNIISTINGCQESTTLDGHPMTSPIPPVALYGRLFR